MSILFSLREDQSVLGAHALADYLEERGHAIASHWRMVAAIQAAIEQILTVPCGTVQVEGDFGCRVRLCWHIQGSGRVLGIEMLDSQTGTLINSHRPYCGGRGYDGHRHLAISIAKWVQDQQ